jgi:hypothetical protein
MSLAHATRANELQVIQDELGAIPEVAQVSVQTSQTTISLLIVIPDHDLVLEKRLAELEGQLSDSFPWLEIDFDIVWLQGRELAEVVSPKGFQLFAR